MKLVTTEDFIKYLRDSGFNTSPFPNFIPAELQDSQLPALFVFGTGGYQANDHFPIEFPTFQVIVIGKNFKSDPSQMALTEQLAKQLIDFLEKKEEYDIGDHHIEQSRAEQSNPIPIGIDNYGRPNYSTNFRFKIMRV